jgi:hypothetical protein
MQTITYVSTAVKLFSKAELVNLLEKSRHNNALHEITGMLLYKNGNFMQTIEGPQAAVQQLYQNIQLDPLHYHVITMLNEPTDERIFSNWHMGFVHLGDPDIDAMPSFANFFQDPHTLAEFAQSPSPAKQLLSTFGQTQR